MWNVYPIYDWSTEFSANRPEERVLKQGAPQCGHWPRSLFSANRPEERVLKLHRFRLPRHPYRVFSQPTRREGTETQRAGDRAVHRRGFQPTDPKRGY